MKNIILLTSIVGLTLCGCAPAVIVATGEVGSSVAEERSLGNIVDDTTIMAKIKSEFARHDIANLLSKISVTVKEGRVMLTGSVPESKYAIEAIKIAWSIPGVREVISELEVGGKSLTTRAKDSWIATTLRTKLLFQEGVNSVNYTVDVNNGIVYLIGIARDKKELSTVTNIARNIKGVREVVSHVTLRDDPRRKVRVK